MGSIETLLGSLRRGCETFPDKRHGTNGTYGIADIGLADIGLAAFSVFFLQSPSFLAHRGGWKKGMGDRTAKACSA